MVENLRARLSKESGIQDLARAMETPFEIDAYDMGVIGSIAYSPELRRFYKETWEASPKRGYKTALEPGSVPEALALRLTQHALPESEQEARRILDGIARTITNPELTNDEASKQHERIYWVENPPHENYIISNAGAKVLDKLAEKVQEFYYSKDLLLHKPSWISDSDWLGESTQESIRSQTIHHFKTQWMNMSRRLMRGG